MGPLPPPVVPAAGDGARLYLSAQSGAGDRAGLARGQAELSLPVSARELLARVVRADSAEVPACARRQRRAGDGRRRALTLLGGAAALGLVRGRLRVAPGLQAFFNLP